MSKPKLQRPLNIPIPDWKRYLAYRRKLQLIEKHQVEAAFLKPSNFAYIEMCVMYESLNVTEKVELRNIIAKKIKENDNDSTH